MVRQTESVYYFSVNHTALTTPPYRPWWEQVFYHGRVDRDDKLVDWVIRSYYPGDGVVRHPMRIRRNTWRIPAITATLNEFLVADHLSDALRDVGSECELLEARFENLYEIPWGGNVKPPLREDATDEEIDALANEPRFRSTRHPGRFFELLLPIAKHYAPRRGREYYAVRGMLRDTRTANLAQKVEVDVDADMLHRYRMLYFGGGGMLCTEDIAGVLRAAADPDWFALDKLAYTVNVRD